MRGKQVIQNIQRFANELVKLLGFKVKVESFENMKT